MRLLIAIVSLCYSLSAAAWWNDDWSQRMPITVDTTATGANIATPLNDVPVLVRLHAGNFPQFLSIGDNGADFRFIAGDDLTPLKHHVERLDITSEMAYVWVRMPAVAPQTADGSFFLYFGNPEAPRGDDAGGTWDVNTVAAFHFSQTAGLPVDSTAYATPVASGQIFPNPASLIGTGATLSGSEPLVLGPAPQLVPNAETGWTFETWIRLNGLPTEPVVLLDVPGTTGPGLSISLSDTGLAARLGDAEVTSFTPLNAANWHHVALVLNAEGLQLFLDGKQVGGAPAAAATLGDTIYVGGDATGGGLLAADLDELRISNIARSPDWIAFAASVQGTANNQVLRYGLNVGPEGGPKKMGSFGIIFQNVFGVPEAWVEQLVIILCGVMMLAAAAIMLLKSIDLARAAGATRKFLVAYSGLGLKRGEDDLDALYAARKQFGDSPLWRVYHVGIDEIRKRVSPSVGAQSVGVDGKAMASVRAAMDATMVREGQRLSSKLVLLTIAISGGPFIGLFGTVVGVMVTFAAIAATGDVNIAAIAPGMAAALLATVAGLGVAIPALFGYNYLSSRVKDQLADMRVFADELIARFNEQYGA